MTPFRLFAATGSAVARIDVRGDSVDCDLMLEGSGAQCVAVDPHDPNRVFVGTFDDGVYRTLNGGESWESVGSGIPHPRVLSIAVSPSHRANGTSVVYVGTEPSELYRSVDDGRTWEPCPSLTALPSAPTWSFPPRPWTSHVRWIAPHYADSDLLFVGIELGGVMRSTDGGAAWEDRKPGSYQDSHAVLTHPTAHDRVYEVAGGGVARSVDRGVTWQMADEGMDRHYVWSLAVDPADPDLWYVSATYSAREAHRSNGDAKARIYRKRGDSTWEALTGDLPYMPYALLTLQNRPNLVIAGFQHGEIRLSEDAGETWRTLDVRLPSLLALAEASVPS